MQYIRERGANYLTLPHYNTQKLLTEKTKTIKK